MDAVKIPPNDKDAEQSVLASMIIEPAETMPIVSGILRPEDFYRPDNAVIYSTMLGAYESGIPVDIVMIKAELEKKDMLDRVGGMDYLRELAIIYSTSAHVKEHALEIKRHSESRQILKSLMELQQKHDSVTVDDIRTVLHRAENNQYVKSYAEKSVQALEEIKLNLRVKKQRVLTGFTILDAITGGFRLPSVATIGAYPSTGKTAFALNIASNQTSPVVFFSLEMSSEMIVERLASAQLKIDYDLFTKQELSETQYSDVEALVDKLKANQFYVFDDAYFIEQQAVVISSVKPVLAVVDYIQKVKTHKKIESRRLEIEYISGMYKQIAKNNNCVILLLSQLARNTNGAAKPTMSSLKESGALEADGDYVGILHRPYVLCKDNPGEVRPEDGYILIDKNKFGGTGQIDLFFKGQHQRFYEVDKKSIGTVKYDGKYVGAAEYDSKNNRQKSRQMEVTDVTDDELPLPFL